MADISDSDYPGSEEDTSCQDRGGKQDSSDGDHKPLSVIANPTGLRDPSKMLPPDKLDFLSQIRKRSQKRREKEMEGKSEGQISESFINKIHGKGGFKVPILNPINKEDRDHKIETLIMKKFNDKGSVNKIIQKTAKLQKNLTSKTESYCIENDLTGDVLRQTMMQRIKGIQRVRAEYYNKGIERKRGKVDTKFIKLIYQNTEKNRRKTRNFPMYDQVQLDFPDANNLLKKRLAEFEFDNDMESDEDEIAKSAYVRLKDLTVCLKESLNKGDMLENDHDDIAIKKAVGFRDN